MSHTYIHARTCARAHTYTHTHTRILCTHTLLPAPHSHQGNLRGSNASVLSFSLPAFPSPSPPLPASLQAYCPHVQVLSLQAMGDLLAGPLALRPHLPSPYLHTVGNEGCKLGQLLAATTPLALRLQGAGGSRGRGAAAGSCSGGGGALTSLCATPPQWTAHPFPFQAESSLHLGPQHIWKSCSLCRQRHVDAPPLYCNSRPPLLAAGFRPLNPTCTRRLVT